MKITRLKIFLFSILLGFTWIYGMHYLKYKKPREPIMEQPVHALGNDVFLVPHYIHAEQYREYKTIIDMQPDDEVSGPYKVKNMEASILQSSQSFHYIPVPKDAFPDSTVSKLTTVLANCERPVLLYCKSGKRAVKTYALSLASNPSGPDLASLITMIHETGHDPDDIKSELQKRISDRNNLNP